MGKTEQSGEAELVFDSLDGLTLHGTYTPAAGPPKATAVLVHGIGGTRNENGLYSQMARALAGVGIASLRFDYRCSGVDSSRALEELTLAGIANDVHAARKALARTLRLEQGPRILIAASFGGGISAQIARDPNNDVSALVLLAPVIDYVQDYLTNVDLWDGETVSAVGREQLDRTGTLATTGRDFSRAMINELPYFSAYPPPTCPIWIAHGDADTSEPLEFSKSFASSAPDCELFVMAGAEHGFADPGDNSHASMRSRKNHELVASELISYLRRRHMID